MYKIWFGVALAALVASPSLAQNYNKNWIECAKELSWQIDHTQKLSDGRTLQMWTSQNQNEAQEATFNDCVARKANLASKPSAKGQPRVSR